MHWQLASTIGLILACAASASAGTLTTPFIFQGSNSHQNVCIAVNVGKNPIEVTVQAVPFDLSPAEARTETCTLPPLSAATTVPSDGGTCETFMNSSGFCRFTAPGSVGAVRKSLRGVMVNRDTSLPPLIATTLEAR
jgi:hypothetical protein